MRGFGDAGGAGGAGGEVGLEGSEEVVRGIAESDRFSFYCCQYYES